MRPIAIAWVLTAFSCSSASAQPPISGLGKSKDGDSLTVGRTEVRLFGIDAPEWDQSCTRSGKAWACGQAAADELSKLVTGKQVSCQPVNRDEHGRTVARCFVGTTDVNRAMVSSGYATAYRHYSSDYVGAEEAAKAAKRGMWAGTFVAPGDYRRSGEVPVRQTRRNRSASAPAPVSNGCTIKGNQGSNGWIYHMPGTTFYERTKAEQMFCSEAEAQAAGYRRARVR